MVVSQRVRWTFHMSVVAHPAVRKLLRFRSESRCILRSVSGKVRRRISPTLNGRKSTFFLDAHDLAQVFRNAKTLSGENVLPEIGAKLFGFDPEAYKLAQHQLEVLTSKMMRGKALLPLTRRMQLELERAFLDIPTHAEHTGLTAFMFETLFPASTRALFGSGVHSTDTIRLFLNLDRPLPFILGNMPSFLFPSFRRAQAALRRLMAPPHENQSEVMDERHRLWDLTNAAERDHAAYDASVLWAAQANTIPAAVWTIYDLLRDPAALGAVTSEVQNVLQAVEEESPHGMPLIGDAHLARPRRSIAQSGKRCGSPRAPSSCGTPSRRPSSCCLADKRSHSRKANVCSSIRDRPHGSGYRRGTHRVSIRPIRRAAGVHEGRQACEVPASSLWRRQEHLSWPSFRDARV